MTSPTRKFIGRRIKAFRKVKGITQAVLADALGCEIATISRYEHGERTPDSEQLLKIAALLDVTPMDILPSEADEQREAVTQLRASLLELIYQIDNPDTLKKLIESTKLIDKN